MAVPARTRSARSGRHRVPQNFFAVDDNRVVCDPYGTLRSMNGRKLPVPYGEPTAAPSPPERDDHRARTGSRMHTAVHSRSPRTGASDVVGVLRSARRGHHSDRARGSGRVWDAPPLRSDTVEPVYPLEIRAAHRTSPRGVCPTPPRDGINVACGRKCPSTPPSEPGADDVAMQSAPRKQSLEIQLASLCTSRS